MNEDLSRVVSAVNSVLMAMRRGLEDTIRRRSQAALHDEALRLSLELEQIRLQLRTTTQRLKIRDEDARPALSRTIESLGRLGKQKKNRSALYAATISLLPLRHLVERAPELYAPFLEPITLGEATERLLSIMVNAVERTPQLPLMDGGTAANILKEIVPAQKIAPVQFEFDKGVLTLRLVESHPAEVDERNVRAAQEELTRAGERIIQELERSNCDPRLLNSIRYLQEKLQGQVDAVQLGLANLTCGMVSETAASELPDAVAMLVSAHSRNVDMFAAQFPDWTRFVENAAAAAIRPEDVSSLFSSTQQLVTELAHRPELVDPTVPETLKRLNELIRNPTRASKRAVFALVRSLENLVSKVFSYAAEFLDQTIKKTIDGLSTTTSKAVLVGLLTVALSSATYLSPLAGTVSELHWIDGAVRIVKQQIELLKK